MPISVYAFVFFISLFFGSFYNVVALRTLSGESIVSPKAHSHCISCQHQLSYWDMVPLFSWLFLRGKCRYCKAPVSGLYPFGEFLTALSYTLLVWKFGFTLETAIHVVFITIMVWATITDLKETMVPDRFVVMGLIGVGALRVMSGEAVGTYLLASLLSFVMLLLILILSKGKMGGADVKLYALIGLTIGFSGAFASLCYASIIALFVNLPLLAKKKDGIEIPFVPFITLGVLGTYIINLYSFIPF